MQKYTKSYKDKVYTYTRDRSWKRPYVCVICGGTKKRQGAGNRCFWCGSQMKQGLRTSEELEEGR